MDIFKGLGDWLTDDRLVSNLVCVHALLGALLILSVLLRKLAIQGGSQLVRWTGLHWLDGISKEAVRHVRRAAGEGVLMRVLEIDPESRLPERRAVLAPYPEPPE